MVSSDASCLRSWSDGSRARRARGARLRQSLPLLCLMGEGARAPTQSTPAEPARRRTVGLNVTLGRAFARGDSDASDVGGKGKLCAS